MAVDSDNSVYITGEFTGTVNADNRSPVGPSTRDPDCALSDTGSGRGRGSVFFAKYDKDGKCEWAHGIGRNKKAVGSGIAINTEGGVDYVYLTGSFSKNAPVDFDPSAGGSSTLSAVRRMDVFFAKYNATDGGYQWAYSMGGTNHDYGLGIAVLDPVPGDPLDPGQLGSVYVTGGFTSTDIDFDPSDDGNPLTSSDEAFLSSEGGSDVFLAMYDTDGKYEWAHSVGGAGDDEGRGIAVDPSGNVMSRAFAVVDPSLAWKPSMTSSVPTGTEFLFRPRRISAFGAPHSIAQVNTWPFSSSTSMWIHECGLIHSVLATLPRNCSGRFASNSAEKA